jgi:hypothetical protein
MEPGVMEIAGPVWLNTYWVENALGLCEGMWVHADELNVDHGHFFALATKYALDVAVLGICKLYDGSTPQYKKDTVLSLNEYLRTNLAQKFARRLDTDLLVDLGASEQEAGKLVASLNGNASLSSIKGEIFKIVDLNMPRNESGSPLKRLFTHRNKNIAHQQQLATLTALVSGELKDLPSLHEMLTLNKWASDFCRFVVTLTSNETLLPHAVSARMAALNVAAKVLGKTFDPSKDGAAYRERETFYRRL